MDKSSEDIEMNVQDLESRGAVMIDVSAFGRTLVLGNIAYDVQIKEDADGNMCEHVMGTRKMTMGAKVLKKEVK